MASVENVSGSSKGLSSFGSAPACFLGPSSDTYFKFPQQSRTHVIETVSLQVYAEEPHQLFANIPDLLGAVSISFNQTIIGQIQQDAILLLSTKYNLSRTVMDKAVEFELPFDFNPKLGGAGLVVQPGDELQLWWQNRVPHAAKPIKMGAKVGWMGYPLVTPLPSAVTSQRLHSFKSDPIQTCLYSPNVNDKKITALNNLSILIAGTVSPKTVEISDENNHVLATLDWEKNAIVVPFSTKMTASFDLGPHRLLGTNFVVIVKTELPVSEVLVDFLARWI